ncbi:MAG: M28 family peptidase, partial [Parasphingopyxis sp.]
EMAGWGRAGLAETPMAPVELMLAPSAGARLLEAAGYDFARLAQRTSAADFEPALLPMRMSGEISTGVYPLTGHNVLAKLPGSGGGGDAVLYLAHHDHLGLCRPEGAADRICNGAVDNASGVAQLIEIAEGLASGEPPDRDIYFLATTAEELGLFGARAFVDAPPLPLRHVVAAINLDTVATSPAGSRLTTVGRGMTPIDPVIALVAAQLGRANYEGEELNTFVERQDGMILLDAGVPALMVGGIRGVAFERFLVGPYHTPDDELTEDTDLSGAAEDVVFHIALGRALADPESYRPPPR